MEWFNVTNESFDVQRRRAVSASFILKAADSDSAIEELDAYLEQPPESAVMSSWKPETNRQVFDIPLAGTTVSQVVSAEESRYYDVVPGDHVRLVEFREFEPAD